MNTQTFPGFCQRVAQLMDLDLVPLGKGARQGNTSEATLRVPNPKIQVCFQDWTLPDTDIKNFIAEFYDTSTNFYLGAVQSYYDEKESHQKYEHFEIGVSPSGQYDEENNPVEVDGELWQFYDGRSLAWAVRSFKMGGAKSGRKPIRKW